MASKHVEEDDDNEEINDIHHNDINHNHKNDKSRKTHLRFNYKPLNSTKEKHFFYSHLKPAMKYGFMVSVKLPDNRHYGRKSAAQYFVAPKVRNTEWILG